jgi:hypothetical protein
MDHYESIDRRDYGRLEADVEHLKKSVDSLQDDVRAMRDMMEQARGGWKTLAMIGGLVSAASTFMGWIIHNWVSK